ncbi:MAG TPA: substrate-binding domain-containing protein [Solirubrobacteraceae bacterium]|nr:substrate-binding domain-containing protein [Solirubrobacteraceae bacterium]
MAEKRWSARSSAAALEAAGAIAIAVFAVGSGAAAGVTPQLAIITAASNQNAFQEMAEGAAAAAAQFRDHLLSSAPPQVDAPLEVAEFEAAEPLARNGIAAMTAEPPVFKVPFAAAERAGVPVVAVSSAASAGSDVPTLVANDNVALGEMMAEQLIKKIPATEKGTVVVGDDVPQLALLGLRIQGMLDVLHRERPRLAETPSIYVTSDPTTNLASWQSLVNKYPHAVAYIGPGDQDAVSMFTISRENHRHYLVGATDVDPQALKAVLEGYVDVLGDPENYLKGYIAIWILDQHARGHKLITGWWDPGQGVITQSNVKQIIDREQSNATRFAYYKATIAKELADPATYIKPMARAGGN